MEHVFVLSNRLTPSPLAGMSGIVITFNIDFTSRVTHTLTEEGNFHTLKLSSTRPSQRGAKRPEQDNKIKMSQNY